MGFELIVLVALIIIFIASFCGLLQKIRESYERDRILASERAEAQQRETSQVYQNPAFRIQIDDVSDFSSVVQQNPPPSYTELYIEPPPKYEDVVKAELVFHQTASDGNEAVNEERGQRQETLTA